MKRFVICIIAMLCLVFCGCAESQKEEGIKEYSSLGEIGVTVYIDPETGVNYLIYEGGYDGGITVRYNSDGTIMVTESAESEG